ncbi:MAG: dienelactone hydrolase family protein [Fibrobacteres bacterium]|nr:dienelactone hydrolase family protein [Fibrobacterota bacterium]
MTFDSRPDSASESPAGNAARHARHGIPMAKASDFDPGVLALFDKYVHGIIDRRAFLREAARFAVGTMTAVGLLDALSPRFAQARKVPVDDPRLRIGHIDIVSPQGYGKVRAYEARPAKAAGKLPVVLVVHENRGLNPHIEDIARRLALEDFIAIAPDALFPLGGYPGNEDAARELFQKLDQAKTREDFLAAARFGKGLKDGNGRLAAVGFCYGGGIVNFLATRLPDLDAASAFYGSAPAEADVPGIKARLQLHFAGTDERINAGRPAYEKALKASKVRYEAFAYPGTQHGFNNDTTPRFDEAAAKLAWQRTLDLFNSTLRT